MRKMPGEQLPSLSQLALKAQKIEKRKPPPRDDSSDEEEEHLKTAHIG